MVGKVALGLLALVCCASAATFAGDVISSNHLSVDDIKTHKKTGGPLKVVSSNYARENTTDATIPMKKAPSHPDPDATLSPLGNGTAVATGDTPAPEAPVDTPKGGAPPAEAPKEAPKADAPKAEAPKPDAAPAAPKCNLVAHDCSNGATLDPVKCACSCVFPWQGLNCNACGYPWRGKKCDVCPWVDPLSPDADVLTTRKTARRMKDGKFALTSDSWKQTGDAVIASGGSCTFLAPMGNNTASSVRCGLSQTVTVTGMDRRVPFSVVLVAKGSGLSPDVAVQLRVQTVYSDGKSTSHPKDMVAHMVIAETPTKTSINIDPLVEPYTLVQGDQLVSFVVVVEATGTSGTIQFVQTGVAAPDPCDMGRSITDKCACSDCPKGWMGDNCNVASDNLIGHATTPGDGAVVSGDKPAAIPYLKGGWKNETNPTHGPNGIPLINATIKDAGGDSVAPLTVDVPAATPDASAAPAPATADAPVAAAADAAAGTPDDLEAIANNALAALKTNMRGRAQKVASTPDVAEADIANAAKWAVVSQNFDRDTKLAKEAAAKAAAAVPKPTSDWSPDAQAAAAPSPKLVGGLPTPNAPPAAAQTNSADEKVNKELADEMEETLEDSMNSK